MIELHNVKKSYSGRTVLDIPSFTIERGGRYALIGPNGSGKSTLLRILSGTLSPDSGEPVFAQGARPDTGYMPQSPHIFDLSVLKNVMLGLSDAAAEKKRLALDALERVGIDGLASNRARKLSGGEAQRLALARLIAAPHALLLLDEPTSSTDIEAGDRIESALIDYCGRTGCTLIFSSHSPGQALRLATHAAVLSSGRIVESGPAGDVLNSPQHEATRDFLKHWRG